MARTDALEQREKRPIFTLLAHSLRTLFGVCVMWIRTERVV